MVKTKEKVMEKYSEMINFVKEVTSSDVHKLHEAEKSYGNSWKQRGGVGAFMMLARKWDRLEKQVKECNYDIFNAVDVDRREEGILDDIGDLRRYLALVEAEVIRKYNSTDQIMAEMQEHPSRISHEEEDMFREDRCEWKTK
jgi:hypothetical protein